MNIQKTDTLLQGYLNFTLGVKSNHSQIEGFKFFPKLKTTALEYVFLSYVFKQLYYSTKAFWYR